MVANCFRLNKSSALCSTHWNHTKRKPEHPCAVAMLRRPSESITEEPRKTNAYNDNLFDRLAINHLSKSVQEATGLSNNKSGYESLVEAATVAKHKFDPIGQQEVIIQALDRAFPRPILSFIKTVLPPASKLSREYFAVFTTLFFAWLVGPCKVRESKVNGRSEKNVVYIPKCRFLEETNCVGMCINLCKMPSQTFIKDSLGMSVNMVPNFDDMSCEMIFGEDPPGSSDDPALKQPCYKLCNYFIARFSTFVLARHIKVMEASASVDAQGEHGWNKSVSHIDMPKFRLISHSFSH